MELPDWVERVMTPLKPLQLKPGDYNAICSSVMKLGEHAGNRLVDAIASAIKSSR